MKRALRPESGVFQFFFRFLQLRDPLFQPFAEDEADFIAGRPV
jgi:hypothetical protein